VDNRGSTSASGITWGRMRQCRTQQEAPGLWMALQLFGSVARGRSRHCLMRKGIWGGYFVSCHDGLLAHNSCREADTAEEQRRGNGEGSEEHEEEKGPFCFVEGLQLGLRPRQWAHGCTRPVKWWVTASRRPWAWRQSVGDGAIGRGTRRAGDFPR
jgi:hypothetical protein